MLIYLSVMVGAYIFTRMFTAGIRAYPNDDKSTITIIRMLSIASAVVALGCTALIVLQGIDSTIQGILK